MLLYFTFQYYQNLFRDEGCFLHIISLLNGNFNKVTDERLVLNVLQTLTILLEGNDASKVIILTHMVHAITLFGV